MLRMRSNILLGRWKGWDHIRGRRKTGGSIHIRHTHGSKGRYDRLSSKYGLRDGRRHAANHMRGGLGIKLGGGLFGLRIPRQNALSSMSPEELEIELHGHPNITNPYRNLLHEHPNIDGVVRNPSLRATFVVAMPRVHRNLSQGLPKLWVHAMPLLVGLARGLEPKSAVCEQPPASQSVALVLATADSSVSMIFDEGDSEAVGAPTTEQAVTTAMELLYKELCKGARIGAADVGTARWMNIDGKKMLVNGTKGDVALGDIAATVDDGNGNLRIERIGVLGWISRLSEYEPVALRLQTAMHINPTLPIKNLPCGGTRHEAESADALIRWFFYNNDPRAHFCDASPHAGRVFPVHTFIDCVANGGDSPVVTRGIVSERTHRLLRGAGYRFLRESPEELVKTLRTWSYSERLQRANAGIVLEENVAPSG